MKKSAIRLLSASTLVLLLFSACTGGGNGAALTRLQGQVDSLKTANAALKSQLSNASTRQQVTEVKTPLEPVVYFPSGSAWLTDAGKEAIDELASKIQNGYSSRKIRVEGHADSLPIVGALKNIYPSNWELSAKRAAAVARYLQEEHGIQANSLGVEGDSDTRPVASNDTPEGRRENRRVQIVVVD